MAGHSEVTPGRCDSCGREDEDVTEVVRLYVVTEAWDQAPSANEAEGTEWWCFPCRTHYPHRKADAPHRKADAPRPGP